MLRASQGIVKAVGLSLCIGVVFGGASFGFAGETTQTQTAHLSQDALWQRGLELAEHGDFDGAAKHIQKLEVPTALTAQVAEWLTEYEKTQEKRKEMDKADYEKYVGYAQARIERKEYDEALNWTLAAADVAADRSALESSKWVQDLANASLEEAARLRKESKWREVWHLYSALAVLFERDPQYQKLEREAVTHLRLDAMFKDEKDSWKERIERVEWRDAQRALEYVWHYYVQPPDFKEITRAGLQNLLLLAESKAAQEALPGLQDEDDRHDFEVRIKARLAQIEDSDVVDRADCIRHLKRVVRDINPETVILPEDLIVSELMRGAFEPLDDFTTMIWPQAVDEFNKHTRGDFIGVGISIIKNAMEEVEVVTPLEDTPAYRAGIQAGDIIAKVDGVEIKELSINKVVDVITGPQDTPVTLTIRRGDKDIEFPLIRKKVKIQSVKGWQRDKDERWNHWLDKENGIGYIRLTSFQRNTAEDLRNVMSELQAEGLKGLVLDLRWNPGGLLDSAWEVSSMFLQRGDAVVSTKGRIPHEDQELFAPGTGPYADVPLTVLVNDGSASASEIVSGAIRDNHRGIVLGERTFGKFSVQNLIPLGPSGAKLKITTARYYLPSGASLHREPGSETWGVEPEIPLRLVRKERIMVSRARRKADLIGPEAPKGEDEAKADDMQKADDDETIAGEQLNEEKTTDAKEGDKKSEKVADAEEKDKLPPLDQPDENDRPDNDPQVEAALLLLRLTLLGEQYPTLAKAETYEAAEQVKQPALP